MHLKASHLNIISIAFKPLIQSIENGWSCLYITVQPQYVRFGTFALWLTQQLLSVIHFYAIVVKTST